jgi:hypothetical protein
LRNNRSNGNAALLSVPNSYPDIRLEVDVVRRAAEDRLNLTYRHPQSEAGKVLSRDARLPTKVGQDNCEPANKEA